MSGLLRYLKVLRLFWGTAVGAEMEYRANFLVAAISSLGHLLGNVFSLFLFYRTGYEFDGWSWEAALVVLGLFTALQGVGTTWLDANLSRIVRQVQRGTLDFVLLKPIDSQFWLSTRAISLWGLADVTFGAIMVGYAGARLGLSASAYLSLIPPLACGVVVLYSLWFMLGATSIWFVKVYNATEVLSALVDAGRFPISAYPFAYRIFFTFIVPVAFMTTVPAQSLLGRSDAAWLGGAAGLAAAMALGSRAFWRFALRYYTSASS